MTKTETEWTYSVTNNDWTRKTFHNGILVGIETFFDEPFKLRRVKHRKPICRDCGVRHRMDQDECDDQLYTAPNGVCPECHLALPLSGECC